VESGSRTRFVTGRFVLMGRFGFGDLDIPVGVGMLATIAVMGAVARSGRVGDRDWGRGRSA
jgi:hypothetical protein